MNDDRITRLVAALRVKEKLGLSPSVLYAFAAAALEALEAHADAENWAESPAPAHFPMWTGNGVPWEAFEGVIAQYAEPLGACLADLERAEAEVARLRGALNRIRYYGGPSVCVACDGQEDSHTPLCNVGRLADTARATLAEGGPDHG